MAFRLSTGFRNLQLGASQVGNHTWANQVLLGEDTTAADLSASWTAVGTALTGNNTVATRTGVLNMSAVNGSIEQEVTVIPGHTYRLTYDVYSANATDTIQANIGTTTLDDNVFSGAAQAGVVAWASWGNSTDETIYNDDALAEDGAIVFTAGASTTSVFLSFVRAGAAADVISLDNVRLTDQSRSLAEVFAGGNIKIYTGTQPTNPSDAPTGTLLVTIDNSGTGLTFGDAASGSVSKTSGETWEGTAGATGTAGWARLCTATDGGALSTTDPRCDMSVGTSGAQINFSSTAFQDTATQTITTLAISIPQG